MSKHWHVLDDATKQHARPFVVRTEGTYRRALKRALAYARTLQPWPAKMYATDPRAVWAHQATIVLERGVLLINECEQDHVMWTPKED